VQVDVENKVGTFAINSKPYLVAEENIRAEVTVIIPTLDAAAWLPGCMAAVAGAAVIVVDGGSGDDTVAVAQALGARVIVDCPGGRGGQMRAGVAAATTKILLLLHADTVLAPGWDAAPPPADAAMYFTLRFDSRRPAARWMERWADWRSRVFRLPYGDQGLLLNAELLARVGGVPDLPIMEDVALARRLGRRLARHPAAATTSAARYERDGFLRRGGRNLVCLLLYFCGVPVVRIRHIYG
jgi:glycosyltransferase involved in cell wall biosynthesis